MNTLQEETNGWLQENSRSLLFLAAILLGGGALMWYLPRAKSQALQTSWADYGSFQEALGAAESADEVNSALLEIEDDSRIYGYALIQSVSWAADMPDNGPVLDILENRIRGLGDAQTGLKVLDGGESVDALQAALDRIEGLRALSALQPAPIEPAGPKIRFSLTNSEGTTYELVYQLYAEQAPTTVAWLLAQVEAGAFDQAEPLASPRNGFQIQGLPTSDEDPPLMVEKASGCFHREGSLSTALESGGDPGQQSRERLQFLGRDFYGQDGVTTVIGQIVEGQDQLQAISELETSPDDPTSFASSFKVTASVVTE